MVCIHCGAETHVTNSRHQRRSNRVWRRRQCLSCGSVFTTEEIAQYAEAWRVINQAGRLQPFSRDKLFLCLHKSFGHRKTALNDASALTDTIINKLSGQLANGTIAASAIARVAQVALNRFDKAASVHYQAFHE